MPTFALPNQLNNTKSTTTVVTNTAGYSVPPKAYEGVPQTQQDIAVTPGVEASNAIGGSTFVDTTNVVLPGTPMNVGTST